MTCWKLSNANTKSGVVFWPKCDFFRSISPWHREPESSAVYDKLHRIRDKWHLHFLGKQNLFSDRLPSWYGETADPGIVTSLSSFRFVCCCLLDIFHCASRSRSRYRSITINQTSKIYFPLNKLCQDSMNNWPKSPRDNLPGDKNDLCLLQSGFYVSEN